MSASLLDGFQNVAVLSIGKFFVECADFFRVRMGQAEAVIRKKNSVT
jgi:hypothetical protein